MEAFEIEKKSVKRQPMVSGSRNGCSKFGYLLTMAGIILFTSGVLVVLHFARKYSFFSAENQRLEEIKSERLEKRSCEEPFCNTKECVNVASVMLDYMNPKTDPCSDFYAYACGSYQRVKMIPYTFESFSPTLDTRMEMLNDLRKSVESYPTDEESSALGKIRTFYDSCNNESVRNELLNKSLSSFLVDLGIVEHGYVLGDPLEFGQPLRWIDLVSQLEEYRIHTLIKPKFEEKSHSSAPERLEIDCQTPALNPRAYVNLSDSELAFQLGIYKEACKDALKLLGMDWEARNEFAKEIIKIETDIAAAILENHSTDDGTLSEENIQLLKDIWRPVIGEAIQEMEIVPTCNLQAVLNVLSHAPNKSVVKYITWRVLMELLRYMSHDFRELYIHYLTKIPGIGYYVENDCAEILRTELGLLSTKILIEKGYIQRETLENVKEVFLEIKEYIALLLGEIEELDDVARKIFRNKLKHMKLTLGFSADSLTNEILEKVYDGLDFDEDYFSNVIKMKKFKARKHLTRLWYRDDGDPINQISLDQTPLGSHSDYDYDTNTVCIELGLLRPPLTLFSDKVPSYLNFGYSSIIARQMIHAFDLTGITHNEEGQVIESPLGITSKEKFESFMECLKNQTLQLKSDVHFDPQDPALVNNIFADLSSFIIPQEGLKAHLRSHLLEKPLPGIPLSKMQTFYLQAAQMMCEIRDNTIPPHETNRWLPQKYRVNQAIMNMEDFREVFDCPSTSAMASENHCSLT